MGTSLKTIMHMPRHSKVVNGETVYFDSADKLILLTIAFCNEEKRPCSYSTISKYAVRSRSSVRRSLNALSKLGLIDRYINVSPVNGSLGVNTYNLNVTAIEAVTATE